MCRAAGKRLTHLTPDEFLSLGKEKLEWAREYEIRWLRSWARFPADGDVYQSVRDVEVRFLTHWMAPFSGGRSCVLPAGIPVRVETHHAEPVSVYANAIDNPELESLIVPLEERRAPNYGGYSLYVTTEQLNRHFRFIRGVGGAAVAIPLGNSDERARRD